MNIAFLTLLVAELLYFALKDIRDRIIPNKAILIACAIWALWRLLLAVCAKPHWLSESASLLVGACAIFGVLLALTTIVETLASCEMFGGGDIKLISIVALYLGVEPALVATFIACIVSLIYAALKSPRGIPFAPGVLCGTLCAVLFL